MEAKFVRSLATEKTYVAAQVRVKEGRLHIQVAGPEGNRGYGFATDVVGVPTELLEWIDTLPHKVKSFASEARYVPVQMRPYTNEIVHIQVETDVPAPGEASRPYGGAFNIHAPELSKYLSQLIASEESEEESTEDPC